MHDNEKNTPAKANLGKMGARLAGKTGKAYWKSFDELAQTPEFEQWVDDEFPNRKSLLQIDRRKFLTLGGAALGLAGLSGCRFMPAYEAVPYVRTPEELTAGKPLVYATTLSRGGYGMGVLVESHEGRPNKVEGNPRHPASLGATDVWAQSELLTMYDPDRSQSVVNQNETSSWDQFLGVVRRDLKTRQQNGGAGLAILTETVTSPTLGDQMKSLMAKYPQAKWHAYEPANRDNVYAGTQAAFGQPLTPVYRLKNADVIVTLDADFLLTMPGSVRYAKDFASNRRVRKNNPKMNRLYAIESSYTITGASADHRFAVKPSLVETVASALYSAVSGNGGASMSTDAMNAEAFAAMVADLQASRGRAVVIPGDEATPEVHALAHALNSALGAVGSTVVYSAPLEATPTNKIASLRELVGDMNAGRVQTLVVLGGNPAYNAPADLKFAEAMTARNGDRENIPLRIHFGMYADETSKLSHWHIAESHPFEMWGDVRAFDGTASIVQPLIAPLYDTRSAHEFIAELADEPRFGYDIVRDYWQTQQAQTGRAFDKWWEGVLLNGVVPNSVPAPITPTTLAAFTPPPQVGTDLEVNFRVDPTIYDGRYANNTWLQELPKPITTITWDNAAIIAPSTAKRLGLIYNLKDNDAYNIGQTSGKRVVAVEVNGGVLKMPIWILPGQPADTITLYLGYGRTSAGAVGGTSPTDTQGFNTYILRTADTMGFAGGAKVVPTDITYEIANTQPHHTLRGINEEENRSSIVVAGTLAEYIQHNGKLGPDEAVAVFPEATGWGHENETEHGVTGVDGSLNGVRSDKGHYNNQTTREVTADSFRGDWAYTDRSSSNKEGWPSLYPEFSNKGFNAWAMSIDLTTCIGCNACTIACQAENNIPTVGKDQVGKGREMHWIRIDHYYAGEDWENPESYFQPVACVHCEKAPCEPVCPVAATVHSHDGINQMVYNRCIGTRYCSNNCPYKVRRFNFLKWTQGAGGPTTLNFVELPVLKMLPNPDVTVRGRGVMEKCTYCVQRISRVRIEAKKEQREIRDGEVITACQQVCPTDAIVFGDINNPNSEVAKLRAEPHDYSLLGDLNTRPRTTYLARVKNTNPAIRVSGPQEAPPKALAPQGQGT